MHSDGLIIDHLLPERFFGLILQQAEFSEAWLSGDDLTHLESGDGSADKRSTAFESQRQDVL